MIVALEGTGAVSGADIAGNVIPVFLLVLGAPLAIWWWMRRSKTGSTNRLKITDKAALGRNVWIAVAEVDGQRFLVGAGEHGVGLLSELESLPVTEAAMDDAPEARTTYNGARALTPAFFSAPAMDRTTEPRMGLIRRLQLMTLRTSARPPRSVDAPLP
jgi:flagellar biogenesis protein FliO